MTVLQRAWIARLYCITYLKVFFVQGHIMYWLSFIETPVFIMGCLFTVLCPGHLLHSFISPTYCLQENATDYAVYHSVHDNFYWMSHFGDPGFTYHVTMGLVWMKTAILLTTTPLPPYDPRHFGLRVREIFDSLEEHYGSTLKAQNITLGRPSMLWMCLKQNHLG